MAGNHCFFVVGMLLDTTSTSQKENITYGLNWKLPSKSFIKKIQNASGLKTGLKTTKTMLWKVSVVRVAEERQISWILQPVTSVSSRSFPIAWTGKIEVLVSSFTYTTHSCKRADYKKIKHFLYYQKKSLARDLYSPVVFIHEKRNFLK